MADIKILEEKVEDAPNSKWLSYAIEGAVLIAALFLVLFLRWNVWETAIITSDSMQPALQRGDQLLIDHREALQNKWKRGDIVIFDTPETWGEVPEILGKRVIGLPGEEVQIYNGQVYVNRQPLHEEYLKEPMLKKEAIGPLTLDPNEYFLLGDNRNYSEDSRDHGPIESRFIRGRAVYQLLPLGRTGRLKQPVYER